MKVLLVFPMQDGQTGLFVKRAFAQLGCQIEVIDPKININTILPITQSFMPKLIFCSRTESLTPEIKKIKKQFPNIITSCWNVDKRKNVKEFGTALLELFNEVDILYTVGKGNVNGYEKECPNTIVKHLQQGCDPKTHKIENCSKEDHRKYDCDVMFAGWVHHKNWPGRADLMDHIASQKDINFKTYSKETKNFITDSEHNKACRCAKIVLGHNRWPSVDISMSVRDYKVMAAGGFLLTEYCNSMEEWFALGKECVAYKDKNEALEKIRYYLKNDHERADIAKNGHDTTHKKHRYVDRMQQVINDVKQMKV